MADKKKRICPDPDCKKEVESDDKGIFDICSHCGFDIPAFDMRRRLTKAERAADEADKSEKDKLDKDKKEKDRKARSVLSNL